MRINCPHCGSRDHSEFNYAGDGTLQRPDDDNTDLKAWSDYIYKRQNPRGRHTELWHHIQGCRLWLSVVRDTVTHKIASVEIIGPWASQYKQKPSIVSDNSISSQTVNIDTVSSFTSQNIQEAKQ
ncbi:MAG: sarcosine oxidase subunit delta [Pseudomonadales bacterium]|nr:sarcosine oxidase subunit delta [Pseudomonadales bacterium]